MDINDKPMLEVLNLSETRWLSLSLSNVVRNLYRIMDLVLSSLNENSLTREKSAEKLLVLLDENFVIVTMFLADLTNILKRLIKIFQLNYVSFSHINSHLKATVNSINEYFIESKNVKPTYGIILCNYMNRRKISSNKLPSFIKNYTIAIIDALKVRFSESKLYNALSIFDTSLLPKTEKQMVEYGVKKIEYLADYYGDIKIIHDNIFLEIVNKENLLEE